MIVANRWHWLLATVPLVAVASFLAVGVRVHHLQVRQAPAQIVAKPAFVAAAPGWIDVQGGTRQLGFQSEGVVAWTAPPGDEPVDAGTVLVRLDDRDLRIQQQSTALELRRQEASEHDLAEQLRFARADVQRLEALVRIQAEPADVLRQAQAALRTQESALQALHLEGAACRIRQQALDLQRQHLALVAPLRGRVLRLDVHEGESVSRGTPVAWFAPEAPLIVRAEVDERLFATLHAGMRAEVESEAGDGHVFPARLLSVARTVGPVRALPETRATARDDHVVECVLELADAPLLIGQRVIVRFQGGT